MLSDRAVILKCLRTNVHYQSHTDHLKMTGMKAIARSYTHCPNIDSDIVDPVLRIERCALAAKAYVKSELCAWPVTSGPRSCMKVNYAGPVNNPYFLIVVDAYSK